MKYTPKKINQAGWVIPLFLLILGVSFWLAASQGLFLQSVLQAAALICIVFSIFFFSNYAIPEWIYTLTDAEEEYPYGRLLIAKRMGSRIIPHAELDLSFAVSFLTKEESKALASEKNRPPFQKSLSAVKNLFARDVYELFIGFRSGNARLVLEIGDPIFLQELKGRVDRAISEDARAKKLRELEEEEEKEEWDTDPLDLDASFQEEMEKAESTESAAASTEAPKAQEKE